MIKALEKSATRPARDRAAGDLMDFQVLIPVMRQLALEAGARIMQVYNGPDFDVKSKSDASPVTEADEARFSASKIINNSM